ncbi:AAA family ATPase, partial [Klebsiella pneumoniae]
NDDKTTEFLGSLAKHIIAQISKDKNSFNKFVKENKNKTEDELRTTLENILNTISPDKNKKNKSNGFFVEMGKEEDKKEEINVSYISTINMNANSNNEINKSSGERTTILAMETETEIAKILSPSESEAEEIEKIEDKSLLMEILNNLFKETDKEIFITSDFIVKKINSDITYEINDLSSGEKQLIYTLLRVANSKRKNQIILMDEPEISLHLSWQEKLLASIKKLRSESQIIVVTHSPGIVMDGWMGNYTEIDNILTMSE